MEKNYFTLYWLTGERKVISGKTIEEAFTVAGYSGGAVKALDWYDNGITESHYWDKEQKTWVKYNPIHIHYDQFVNCTLDELSKLFEQHHAIEVDLATKDRVVIQITIGDYAVIGWTKSIEVYFAEYCTGSYFEDGDEDYHFMVCNTEYFDPSDAEKALAAFMNRVKTNPGITSGVGVSLDTIKQLPINQF